MHVGPLKRRGSTIWPVNCPTPVPPTAFLPSSKKTSQTPAKVRRNYIEINFSEIKKMEMVSHLVDGMNFKNVKGVSL